MRSHRTLAHLFSCMLVVLLLGQVLSSFPVVTPVFAAASGHPHSTPGALTFGQYLKQGRQDKINHTPVHPTFGPPRYGPPPGKRTEPLPSSTEAPTMKPLTTTLSSAFLSKAPGATSVDLKSSDGRLEVQLPPGSFDLSHATVATGKPSGTTGTKEPTPGPKMTPTAHGTPKAPVTGTATPTATPTTSPTPPATFAGPLTVIITEQHGYFVGENVNLGSYQFQFLEYIIMPPFLIVWYVVLDISAIREVVFHHLPSHKFSRACFYPGARL